MATRSGHLLPRRAFVRIVCSSSAGCIAFAACLFAACTSEQGPIGAGSDDATTDGADASRPAVDDAAFPPPSYDAAPPVCNALAQRGSVVAEVAIAEAPPPATSGPIEPGIYVLRSKRLFTGLGGRTGPTGALHVLTMEVKATEVHSVQQVGTVDGGMRAERTTVDTILMTPEALEEADGGLVLLPTCPASKYAALLPYIVEDGGISFVIRNDDRREVWSLERLP